MKAHPLPVLTAVEDAWAEHLQDVFRDLSIPSGTMADNIAASIAAYCSGFHPQGLQATELKLLVARAFCAVGDPAAAGHVLESMVPHRHHVSRWLEILTELHHFPDLLPFFSAGIIRPADWAGARLDRMWTLDFGKLVLAETEKHEMLLYRSIQVIIEKMSVFWDATEGEGVLGLKSLDSWSVDKEGAGKAGLTARESLMDYMADLFSKFAAQRGWGTTPVLMNLDL